ncbi:hypothetical protein ACFL3V_00060 [Nanoarchaeota archaeon]
MSRADTYQKKTRQMSHRLKIDADRTLQHYLKIAKNAVAKAKTTVFDGEKVDGIESLVYCFAQSLKEVFDHATFDTQNDFDWLATNYGPAFDTGTSDAARGFMYQSTTNTDDSIVLGISPKDSDFEELIKVYEQAIVKDITPRPNGFTLQFEDDVYDVDKGVPIRVRSIVLEVSR